MFHHRLGDIVFFYILNLTTKSSQSFQNARYMDKKEGIGTYLRYSSYISFHSTTVAGIAVSCTSYKHTEGRIRALLAGYPRKNATSPREEDQIRTTYSVQARWRRTAPFFLQAPVRVNGGTFRRGGKILWLRNSTATELSYGFGR